MIFDQLGLFQTSCHCRANNKIQDIQQPDKYKLDWFQSDSESAEEGDFEVVYGRNAWPCREDQYEIMTGAVRLDLWGWCHIDGYTTYIFSH